MFAASLNTMWTEHEDSLCRSLAPAEVAAVTERLLHAVCLRRHRLGLPDRRAEAYRERGTIKTVIHWNETEDELVRISTVAFTACP